MGLDGDTISMEWTNYNPSAFVNQSTSPVHSADGYSSMHHLNHQQQQHPHQQQQHQLPTICLSSSSGDTTDVHHLYHTNNNTQTQLLPDAIGSGSLSNGCDITFINIDQLNMEQLKTECILSEDNHQNCLARHQMQHLPSHHQHHQNQHHHQDGSHLEHRMMNITPNDMPDGLDVPNDEYQTIRVDDSHQQEQLIHSQHSNAFQYHHHCTSSILDFHPFGWITDRSNTPPSVLETSVQVEQVRHSSGASSGREDADEKNLNQQY